MSAQSAAGALPRRILVVDDSEDNADLLAMLLEDQGYCTRTALDGASALEIAAEQRPDVVILDLGLPDRDGFDVASELRRRFGDELWIVALTGYSGPEHRERARRCSINFFLTKPLLPAQLEALLADGSKHRLEPQR